MVESQILRSQHRGQRSNSSIHRHVIAVNLGHQAQSSIGTVEERHKQRENFPNTVVQMLCVEGVLVRTPVFELGFRFRSPCSSTLQACSWIRLKREMKLI